MEKTDSTVQIRIKKDLVIKEENPQYLYYHLENVKGILDKYAVIEVKEELVLELTMDAIRNKILRIHYFRFTEEYNYKH